VIDMWVMTDIFFYPCKEPEYAGFVSSAGKYGQAAGQGFWKKIFTKGKIFSKTFA